MSYEARIAQQRMNEHLRTKDIIIGGACVKADKINGVEVWVLPGRRTTRDREYAASVCHKMNNLINQMGGIRKRDLAYNKAA